MVVQIGRSLIWDARDPSDTYRLGIDWQQLAHMLYREESRSTVVRKKGINHRTRSVRKDKVISINGERKLIFLMYSVLVYFRDKLQDYVPPCMFKGGSRWIKNKQAFSNVETRIFRHWEDISKKVKSKADCYRLYLQFCWKLPFYG